MLLSHKNVFRMCITPDELREIADQIEKRWSQRKPEDENLVLKIISEDYKAELEIGFDQEKMFKKYRK